MQGTQGANAAYSPPKEIKGTAVDSVNANLENLTSRLNSLAGFAGRISDGLIGVTPETGARDGGPRPVSQSTQDHIRDLESAVQRLSGQINRLG